MLYDPMREIQDIHTVSRFKQWLDQQPPQGRYDYGMCEECALAKYIKASGFADVIVSVYDIKVNYKYFPLPKELNYIAEEGDHSFGEAAKRAEAVLTNGNI